MIKRFGQHLSFSAMIAIAQRVRLIPVAYSFFFMIVFGDLSYDPALSEWAGEVKEAKQWMMAAAGREALLYPDFFFDSLFVSLGDKFLLLRVVLCLM